MNVRQHADSTDTLDSARRLEAEISQSNAICLNRKRFYTIALALVVMLFVAVNARWIWLYRHGGVYDIDESGYLTLALFDYAGLIKHGILGWISAIEMPSIQAPLTTTLASLVFVVTGAHVIAGFVVTVAAGAGCVVAAYALGCSVGSRGVGLAAAILTASCPVIVNYARSFQFSTVATLMATLTVIAILRSRQFRSIGWSLLFGIFLGLMPLARTMLISFIPGIVVAAVIVASVDSGQRLRRLFTLVTSGFIAVLVSAIWLIPNGPLVAHYLLSYGYGVQAKEYGPQVSKFGLVAWQDTAQAFSSQIYIPHFLLIILGMMVLSAILLRSAVQWGLISTLRRVTVSQILPVVIFVAGALAALTSSGNKGTGFFAPIIPACMVLTAWAFWHVHKSRVSRAGFAIVMIAIAVIAVVPLLDLHTVFAPEWSKNFPILGGTTITNGKGTIQTYEMVAGYGTRDTMEPISSADGKAWNNLSGWTADLLTQKAGQKSDVAYGFRSVLYNVNTINLQQFLRHGTVFSGRMIEPTLTGKSVSGYLGWLQQQASDACALLTSNRVRGDFAPEVDPVMMQIAARQAGFIPIQQWPAPDGQLISLWKRRMRPLACP
ncbi:glycosyltransferase family 39 protein [Acidisoma cellulosilytica]|uniref:Glycosyltransferase family 39 protein n=1 Tax=Acidisoma cellulosilyticum TaxID=2802395 RepID=A0A963Z8A8_9PROT|nr:glycosyltransferase family 39 protein [Acidisoma cellulosilyticum]MCB8883910.1 glycosyltransferase family 39 protein [Acidisoma cellulosilyticum]